MPQSNVVRLIEKSWRPPRIVDRTSFRRVSGSTAYRVLLVVLEQPVRVGGEAEEVVLLDHALDGPLVDRAEAVDEVVLGVVGLARHAVQALVRPQVDVVPAVVVDRVEELLDRGRVARLGGPDVVVVGDVQAGPDLLPTRLHLVDPLLGGHAPLLGGPLELQAVLVGAGEVEDLLAAQPVEPGDEVGGHGVVRVPDVGHVVRVVDRRGDVEDVAAHGRVMVPAGTARGRSGPPAASLSQTS